MALPGLGQGDEYELRRDIELVHADDKVVAWRALQFERLGFSKGEALSLARWRSAELHDVEKWLENGCTHAQALQIVAPLVELPTSTEMELYAGEAS